MQGRLYLSGEGAQRRGRGKGQYLALIRGADSQLKLKPNKKEGSLR